MENVIIGVLLTLVLGMAAVIALLLYLLNSLSERLFVSVAAIEAHLQFSGSFLKPLYNFVTALNCGVSLGYFSAKVNKLLSADPIEGEREKPIDDAFNQSNPPRGNLKH